MHRTLVTSLVAGALAAGFLAAPAMAAPTACSLVSAAEMSAILGSAVMEAADDRGGQTKCTYAVPEGEIGGAYAEVQLNWGDGAAGMAGAGAVEPQLGAVMSELAGVGDQTVTVGPMVLIRRGDDLITVILSGIADNTAAIKTIYALLDKRLRPGKAKP